MNKEGQEIKENNKLKEPNGLELAMKEEWDKYELVLREN